MCVRVRVRVRVCARARVRVRVRACVFVGYLWDSHSMGKWAYRYGSRRDLGGETMMI